MNVKKIIANAVGTLGYLSWLLGAVLVLAGIANWLLNQTNVVVKGEDTVVTVESTPAAPGALIIISLLCFVLLYFIAGFARKLVWSLKRYTKASDRKFQALVMLDLTIAWTLVGAGMFIAGFDLVFILAIVIGFALIGYVSLALEFYLRSLWKLPTR